MPLIPASLIKSTISFNSCRHSKVRHFRLITRLDQRFSYPAWMSAVAPPQSTACSPNKSVSVSSLKVVSITPARVPPIPLAQASAIFLACLLGFWKIAIKAGTPLPSTYCRRTMCPGPFGATMMTSTFFGGTMVSKWMANP